MPTHYSQDDASTVIFRNMKYRALPCFDVNDDKFQQQLKTNILSTKQDMVLGNFLKIETLI